MRDVLTPGIRAWRRLCRRRAAVYAALFVLGAGLAALPFAASGPPPPAVHDEFANLLIAETLLSGRLANPPHPRADSFETFHVLQHPAYAGKYLPGAGLQLALGPLFGAPPILGVWFAAGAFAVALCWMIESVAARATAAPGSLLVVTFYVAATTWGGSYWGGTLFALGGALVLGGAARLVRWPGWPVGALAAAGAGVAIFLLTRPYEGAWFCVGPALAVAAALWRRARRRPEGRRRVFAALLAGAFPVALTAALLLACNRAATGDAFTFAHRLYERTVMPDRGLFVWDTLAQPATPRHPLIAAHFTGAKLGQFTDLSVTAREVLARVGGGDVRALRAFLLPWWLWPLALAGAAAAVGRGARAPLLALFTLLLWFGPACTLRFFAYPHYFAAWAAPVALLAAAGWRHAWFWAGRWRRARWALALWATAAAGWVAADYAAFAGAGGSLDARYVTDLHSRAFWRLRHVPMPMRDRAVVFDALAQRAAAGRRQLVLVEYPPDFAVESDWVYNGPDVDAQRVVWARAWDPARDIALLAHYPAREAWLARLGGDGRLRALAPLALAGAPLAADAAGFAQTTLARAQALPVRDPQSALLAASAALRAGELARADELFRRALQFEPDLAEAHYNLGVVALHRGQPAEARACFEETLRLDPGMVAAHNNLGTLLYHQQDVAGALAHYERGAAVAPDDLALLANYANALLHANRPADAAQRYRRLIALDPANADWHKGLGDALTIGGQPGRALASYEEALRLRPDFPDARQNLEVARRQAATTPEPSQ